MSYEEVERLVRKEKLEDKYDVGPELGRGKFAIVKRVTEKDSGEQYAAKFLRKRRGGKACRDDIIVEVDIMRQSMSHHRIIKLREVFESTREMIIIIELATGGELFRMIAVDPLPEDKARSVVLQLLEGVEHLHSLSIVHLDLKPENILLYRKGQLDIRIADFGLALQIAPGEQVKTLVGTAEYVAPEILNYEPLTVAADMWSIGALTYALLAGYSPFQGETHSHTFCNVSMCEYDFDDEVFDDVSQEAKDFIEELLQKNPSDRLTATKCLNHSWMKNHNSTLLSPQSHVINMEGLNSSTSSLDSALCMDSNTSSLDPSPSSSASSSFAPRPSGGRPTDEDEQQENMKKQLTEKVSKLCTEMQRVETDKSSRGQLDGSASSISSNDSNATVKVDEEDGGENDKVVFEGMGPLTSVDPISDITPLPSRSQTTTPPICQAPPSPPLNSGQNKRSPSSSSAAEEDGGRSASRPSSALRVTTPIDDLVSLAPDTIEKMKKLERLKRKRDENQHQEKQPLTRKLSGDPISNPIAPRNSERRVSSPAVIKNHRVATKLVAPVEEEETPSSAAVTDVEKTPPVEVKEEQHQVEPPRVERSVMSSATPQDKNPRSVSPKPLSPQARRSVEDKPRPALASNDENREPMMPSKVAATPPKIKFEDKPVSSSLTDSFTSVSNRYSRSSSPQHTNNDNIGKSSIRAKSDSPSATTGSSCKRFFKSSTPGGLREEVKRRTNVSHGHVRKSWRNTPHIDPDAIDAILRGEIDDDMLATEPKLETMTEVSEPRSNSPLAGKTSAAGSTATLPSRLREPFSSPPSDTIMPILKKGGSSESRIFDRATKSESPRRNVTIIPVSTSHTGTVQLSASPEHLSRIEGSPLKSPGAYSQTEGSPVKNHLSVFQSSMSLSRSTPDLSSIIGSSKSHSKRAPPREDSYVMGGSSSARRNSRGSVFRSTFGNNSIVRSLTMSAGRSSNSKRSPAHSSKDKAKLK